MVYFVLSYTFCLLIYLSLIINNNLILDILFILNIFLYSFLLILYLKINKSLAWKLLKIYGILAIILFVLNIPILAIFWLVLFLSIFLHELGHLFFLLIFKVKTNSFNIWFWQIIKKIKIKNIHFNIRLIPLWWFVDFEDKKYLKLSLYKKILINLGWIIANFLLVIIWFLWLYFITDFQKLPETNKKLIFQIENCYFNPNNDYKNYPIYKKLYVDTKNIFIIYFKWINYIIQNKEIKEINSIVGASNNVYKLQKKIKNISIKKIMAMFFIFLILINSSLIILNILPIPWLDGYHVVKNILIWFISLIFQKPSYIILDKTQKIFFIIESLWLYFLSFLWFILILLDFLKFFK